MARPRKNLYADVGLEKKDLEAIRRRVSAAVRYADEYRRDTQELVSYYGGNQFNATPGNELPEGDHRIVVNRLIPNIELKSDIVAFEKPEFILTAHDPLGRERARVAKAGMDYFWRTEDIQEECKKALKDSKIVRYGVVYIGWRFETDDGTLLDNERMLTEGDALDPEAMAAAVADGQDPLQQIPRERVIVDAPCVRRIRPCDLMFEPGADSDLDSARYLVWQECLPLEEVKANPRYQNTDKLVGKTEWFGDTLIDEQYKNKAPEERPEDLRAVKLYHYYERHRRIHCVYADECPEDYLLVERWPWPFRGYPFEILVSHPVPDASPGECQGDVDLARPLQDSLNLTRSLAQNHLEQYSAKWQTRQGNLTPAARRQLRSTKRNIVVEHNGSDNGAIQPVMPPPLNPEVYQLEERSLRDLDYELGVSDYQRNMLPSGGRRTATEVAALNQTGSGRVDTDIVKFSKFLSRVARKVLALLKEHAHYTRTLPIYDEFTNADTWVDFNAEAIRGEYEIEVEVGSTQAVNKEAEKQNAVLLLQALTPFLQMVDPATQMPLINPIPLLRRIVELSGIKNAAEIIAPPPPPPAMAPALGPAVPPGADPMAAEMEPAEGMALPPMEMLAGLLGGA